MENKQDITDDQESTDGNGDISLFTIGGILSITFRALFKNPIVFFGLTIFTTVLAASIEYSLRATMPGIGERTFDILNSIIMMLFWQWIGGAMAYGVFHTIKGNNASLGASLFHGMRRYIQLVCIGFIFDFGATCGLILVYIPGIAQILRLIPVIAPILLLIPGFIVMCTWFVVVPACVVERMGVIDSLFRSAYLTKGCRLKIFGILLIMIFSHWAVMTIAPFFMPTVGPGTYHILLELVGDVTKAFKYIMPAVIYFELRRVKEGVAVDSLANVFD